MQQDWTPVIAKLKTLDPETQRRKLEQMSEATRSELIASMQSSSIQPTRPAAGAPAPIPAMRESPVGNIYRGVREAVGVVNPSIPDTQANEFSKESFNQVANILKGLGITGYDFVRAGASTDRSAVPFISKEQANIATDLAKSAIVEPVQAAAAQLRDTSATSAPELLGNATAAALGADVEGAKQSWENSEWGKWAAQMLTVPVAGLIPASRLTGAKRVPTSMSRTRAQLESLGSLEAGGKRRGVMSTTIAENTQDMFKQVLNDWNLDPNANYQFSKDAVFPSRERAPQSDTTGNLRRGGTKQQADAVAKRLGKDPDKVKHIALEATDEVVRRAHEPIARAIDTYGKTPLTDQLRTAIKSDIDAAAGVYEKLGTPEGNSLAKAIRAHSASIDNAKTIADLNDLKVFSNKQMEALFNVGDAGKAIAVDVKSIAAIREFSKAIKSHLYPELERLGGPKLKPFLDRESFAIQARDGIYEAFFDVADPAQAELLRRSFGERLIEGQSGQQGSMFTRQIASRAVGLVRTPIGQFNVAFRRGVGELGRGMTPDTFTVGPSGQRLLPAKSYSPDSFSFTLPDGTELKNIGEAEWVLGHDADYFGKRTGRETSAIDDLRASVLKHKAGIRQDQFAFTIRGELPVEVIEGPMAETPRASYIDNTSRIEPNPAYTGPVESPRLPVNTDPRLPERYRNQQTGSDASRAADQLGTSAAAVPDRSFTGPAQRGPADSYLGDAHSNSGSTSNWQLISEVTGEGQTRRAAGAGTLITTDEAVVQSTIQNINRYLDARAGSLPKAEVNRLQSIQRELVDQLSKYNAYTGAQAPRTLTINRGNMGTVERGRIPATVRYPAAGATVGTAADRGR